MCRVSVVLMTILLIFNATPVSFGQPAAVQAQAVADATADMSDRSKAMWLLFGGLGSTAGCLLGCVSGCFLGARLDPHGGSDILLIPTGTQAFCAATGAIVLGGLAVPMGVRTYPHNVIPPPERLLGKSPEYIEVYTQTYHSKTAALRKRHVTTGSIAGNVGFLLSLLLLYTTAF